MKAQEIALIGGGNMAQAIVRGVGEHAHDPLGPLKWHIAEPDAGKREMLARLGGVKRVVPAVTDLRATLEQQGDQAVVVLAVKPQALARVAEEVRGWELTGLVISILAGVKSEAVRQAFGGRVRVVRVMPNMPAAIRSGMSAVCEGAGSQRGDAEVAEAIFSAVGEVVRIEESLMDAFTAVAGSGPAYLFYLAEAMERAAIEVGLDPKHVRTIVTQTIFGAAELLRGEQDADGRGPADLRAAVTSPGGTTAAAVGALEQAGVMEAVVGAVVAARDRGRQLGA